MNRAFFVLSVFAAFAACAADRRVFPESAFLHAGKGGCLIDVTQAPFFAKGDGIHDDTAALKAALKFAKDNTSPVCDARGCVGGSPRRDTNWTVYLPRGTYLVSDTVAYGWPAVAMDLRFGWRDVRYIRIETAEAEERLRRKPRKPGEPPLHGAEVNWNIRLLGESRETTVLRLKDGAAGFGEGAHKPILSYHLLSRGSNVNYGNFLEGVTVDAGCGNPGAVGVKWSCSNYGAIRDVALKGRGALVGVDMPVANVCGYFQRLSVEGFRTAFRCAAGHESTLTVEDVSVRTAAVAFAAEGDSCGGSLLNLRHVSCADVATNVVVTPGRGARVVIRDCPFAPDTRPALVKAEDAPAMQWPALDEIATPGDFGAVGDGRHDDTAAIQRAMDSGRRAVFFTRPAYAIEGTVTVPASVTLVEGLFSGLCRHDTRKAPAMFRVSERSDAPLEVRRFYVVGAKLVDHEKARTAVLNDIFVEFPQGRGAATTDDFFFPGRFVQSPLQWYAYRNSDPSVRKRLFAANCVGLCAQAEAGTWNYLENVDLQARAINNERDAAKIDGAHKFEAGGSAAYALKNCRAWVFGAKSELCRTSVDFLDSTLDMSGFNYLNWDPSDFPESPVIRATRSQYAIDGFFWKTKSSQPIVLRETDAAGRVTDRMMSEFPPLPGENGFSVRLMSRDAAQRTR